MRNIELLAPAGGMDALHAAVQNGADAVYLGEKSFSARQSAENFGAEELKTAVRYAHERGTKVYLAMNTLIDKNECNKFAEGVTLAAKCGVDALIIQDFGGAKIAKEVCPTLERHASTQMSAHNEKDVTALMEAGFSRIVLARELGKSEIAEIYNNTRASLEVFVHGALCVCVSGQCLMSSFIGGRSGNRGKCAQPCRQLYTVNGKTGYYLSPRDLCLLDEVESLYDIGVDSLKIEGRMKRAEYVATVTGIYRKYLDNPKKATAEDIRTLEKIFVRGDGFTKAYYAGVNTPEMMNYTLSNDGVSTKSDKDVLKQAQQSYRDGVENKKVGVSAYFTAKENAESYLVLSDGENTAESYGAVAQRAVNVSLDEVSVRERVAKMGQTPFVLEYFDADIDENIMLSAKDINFLRRDSAEKLLSLRGAVREREVYPFEYSYTPKKRNGYKIAVSVLNNEQLRGAKDADFLYMPLSLYEKVEKKENYIVMLPKVVYNFDAYVKRLKACGALKVLASTFGVAKAMQKEGFEVIGDWGLNVYNPISANEYKNAGINHITLSPELTAGQIRDIAENTDATCEILCYGRQMMMVTRACIIKGVRGKCDCEKPLILRDRTGAEFFVYSDKSEHINMIYNTSVTFMADKLNVLKNLNIDMLRLVFTDENAKTVSDVIKMYKGESDAILPASFTRGYFVNSKKFK